MKDELTNLSTLAKKHYDADVARYSEVSLFEAIGNAVDELKRESDRVALGHTCVSTITTGELEKVRDNVKHATRLLAKILFLREVGAQPATVCTSLPIPATVEALVRTLHEVGYGDNKLNYVQAVRALTDALKRINDEQLALGEREGLGAAA